jgi:zinc protease
MRDEQLAELLQRQVEPRALADDMAARFLFADGSTYARPLLGRRGSVERFDAEAVRRFHRERFSPASTTVVLAGAVDGAEARALVGETFGDWQGDVVAAPAVRVEPRSRDRIMHLVDRPGAVQSELRFGHAGVPRSHPDYFRILVMNGILGGTFTSRLNLSLREKHGFTYGVRSGFAWRRAPGPFVIQTAVGTDVTVRAIEEASREIERMLRDGATHDEVAAARNYLAGIFPLELQTTEHLAAKLADIAIYDLPDDYFEHYRERITAVTADDVNLAARQYVRPAEMTIVVVGDGEQLAEPLAQAGVAPVVRHPAAEVAAPH